MTDSDFIIRGRAGWHARPPKDTPTRDNWKAGVGVVVHHTADTYHGKDVSDEIEHLRAMQYFHQTARGWDDIGYNLIIFPSGRVWAGRGFQVRGAHVLGHNTGTCGITFVGTYSKVQPTPAAHAAYKKTLERMREHGFKVKWVKGHGDLMATACPGEGVRRMLNLPHPRRVG